MKAIQEEDLDTAAVLIRLGADVFAKNRANEAPIDLIFHKNLDQLMKVIEEVLSAQSITDLQKNSSKNCSAKTLPHPKLIDDSKTNKYDVTDQTPIKKLVNFFDRATTILSARKVFGNEKHEDPRKSLWLLNLKDKAPSDEVLTTNTNLERTINKIDFKEENFIDSVFEFIDEPQRELSQEKPLSDYKHQINSYSEEINQMNQKIKVLSEVILNRKFALLSKQKRS